MRPDEKGSRTAIAVNLALSIRKHAADPDTRKQKGSGDAENYILVYEVQRYESWSWTVGPLSCPQSC